MFKKTVLYSTFLLSASSLVKQLMSFIYRIIISRMAGAQGMALYQLIWPFYDVVSSVTIAGICVAATKLSAEKKAENDRSAPALISVCKMLFSVIFVIIAVLAVIGNKWIAATILGDKRTAVLILLMIPTLFLTGFENIYKSFFHGIHNVMPAVVSETVELAIRIASAFALMLAFKTDKAEVNAALIIAGMLVSEVFSSQFMRIAYKRKIKREQMHNKLKGTDKRKLLKQISVFALPVTGAGLLTAAGGSATFIMIPRLLMVWGMPREEAMNTFGVLMGMVAPFVMFPMIFISSLSAVVFPRLSTSAARGNTEDIKRKIGLSMRVTSLFSLPITAIIIIVGPSLCHMLFNQNPDKKFFAVLALSSVLGYYEMILANILNGTGMEKKNAVFAVISEAITLAVTCIAIPLIGIYGYIAGVVSGSIFRLTMSMITVFVKGKIKTEPVKTFVSPLVTAALCGFLGNLFFEFMLENGFAELSAIIYMSPGCIILYTILMNIQGVRPYRYVKSLIRINQQN